MLKKKLHILKIGGKLINEEEELTRFLRAAILSEDEFIIVHGGGRKATELSALLGISTKMVDGRRITDADTLDVAIMVYAGLVNKKIVAKMQRMDVNAIGLSGADANVITAHKRPVKEVDYGFVGDLDHVDGSRLNDLISIGLRPVVCAISHDGKGQLLNTNADTIAAQIAIAMSPYYEVSLRYCFEYMGVLYDISSPDITMNTMSQIDFKEMVDSGVINTGMIPKLSNGFDALTGGVKIVSICGIDNLWSLEQATQLYL